MSESQSRKQPLISEVYDIPHIPSNPMTPSLISMNLNQTYDISKKKKKQGRNMTNHSSFIYSLANTKEEMIQEFIVNEKQYEQQKELKLNELKSQKRLITYTSLKKIPEIDSKSNFIAQRQNNKPIYDRVNEVNRNRQENIETLRSLYTNTLKEDQLSNKGKAFANYSERTMKWVKKQDEWLKNKNQRNQNQLMDMNENKMDNEKLNQMTQLTNNKIMTRNTNADIAKCSLSLKRELMIKETNPSFTPKLNRNRSETSKLYPNYIPLHPKKNKAKSNFSCKKIKTHSVDESSIKKEMKPKIEHWSSLLLNLRDNYKNDNENMYRINIYPSGAWNENSMNNVNMNSQTKKIISHLFS